MTIHNKVLYLSLIVAISLFFGCNKKKKNTVPKNPPKSGQVKSKEKHSNDIRQNEQIDNQDASQSSIEDTKSVRKTEKQDLNKEHKNNSTIAPKGNEKHDLSLKQKIKELIKSKKYSKAEQILISKLNDDYQNYQAMLLLSEVYLLQNKTEMAIKILMHIRSLKQKNKQKVSGQWHFLMGRYYLYHSRLLQNRGLYVEAINFRNKAIKELINPLCKNIPQANYFAGMLYVENREFSKGFNYLRSAISQAKNRIPELLQNPKLHFNLGVASYHLKKWKMAYDEWVIALSLSKNNCPKCHFNLAILCSLDAVKPEYLGWGDNIKSKSTCLKKHARAYSRYLENNRIRDKRLAQLVRDWLAKSNTMLHKKNSNKRGGSQ